jgi:hypothetical protein
VQQRPKHRVKFDSHTLGKKIQQLTELGMETVKLISDIDQIKQSHLKVKNLMVENFGIQENLDETQIKNRLFSKGWRSKETDFYREFTKYAVLLITESLNMVYNLLMYRYSSLFAKYDIRNTFAKQILNRIILDALEYHISNAGDHATIKQLYFMKDNNEGARAMIDRILSSIDTIEEHNPYLNRFTDKEGKSLLTSICSLLKIPKKVIEDYISIVKSDLKFIETDPLTKDYLTKGEDTHFYKGSMLKNTYKEARRKSLAKLSILEEML